MPQWVDVLLRVIGSLIGLAGLVVVYAAPMLVRKYKLDEKKNIDPERLTGMSQEQISTYRYDTAVLDVKLRGVMLALPGFILLLVLFKI